MKLLTHQFGLLGTGFSNLLRIRIAKVVVDSFIVLREEVIVELSLTFSIAIAHLNNFSLFMRDFINIPIMSSNVL